MHRTLRGRPRCGLICPPTPAALRTPAARSARAPAAATSRASSATSTKPATRPPPTASSAPPRRAACAASSGRAAHGRRQGGALGPAAGADARAEGEPTRRRAVETTEEAYVDDTARGRAGLGARGPGRSSTRATRSPPGRLPVRRRARALARLGLRLLRLDLLRPARRRPARHPARLDRLHELGRARPRGDWVTIYANAGHAYMTVAGFRFDTSGPASAPAAAGAKRRGRARLPRPSPGGTLVIALLALTALGSFAGLLIGRWVAVVAVRRRVRRGRPDRRTRAGRGEGAGRRRAARRRAPAPRGGGAVRAALADAGAGPRAVQTSPRGRRPARTAP